MKISGRDHLFGRRGFLRKGMRAGALIVSYPVWRHFAGKDTESLLPAEAGLPAGLDKETLSKLLEICLSRGGEDKLNARLMKMKPTGNGRRQSYKFPPYPRMTNTYLLPGTAQPEDIVKSEDKGVYIAKIGGGNVTPATGRFVFSVTEGHMIESGKVTKPLKGIMLMGSGQEVLKNISIVGTDLLVIGGGWCGKAGQSKPVGSGNPTLKVDKITVGGKKA